MPIAGWARRAVVTGVIVVPLAIAAPATAAPPVATRVHGGSEHMLRILYDQAPAYVFMPDAMRMSSFITSELVGEQKGGVAKLTVTTHPVPDFTAEILSRLVFYPPNATPWGLEWKPGDRSADVVTQARAGTTGTTADALPQWEASGARRPLVIKGNVTVVTLPAAFLHRAGVALPGFTGLQIQHQATLADGSPAFQGSPIGAWAALIGQDPRIPLSLWGLVYDPAGHAVEWVVARAPSPMTVTDDDLAGRAKGLEAMTTGKHGVITSGSPLAEAGGDPSIDQIRAYAQEYREGQTLTFDLYNGVICQVPSGPCDEFSGNDHSATVTGEASIETKQVGRRIDFTIVGAPFLNPRVALAWDIVVRLDADTRVALRAPTVWEVLPRGLVDPAIARDFFLDASELEPYHLTVDASQLSTVTDANQLPVGDTTRANYAANGFLAEYLNFYTVPGVDANNPAAAPAGKTAFFSQSSDVFNDAAGADNVHQYLESQVKNATNVDVLQKGSGPRPTILQNTSNGLTTTTAFWNGADNAIVVLRSSCNQCTSDGARKDFDPVLKAVQRHVRAATSR